MVQDEEKLLFAKTISDKILSYLGNQVFGQEEVCRKVLVAFLAGGHVLVEGVPGIAKTLLVTTMAQLMGLHVKRIQFTPDLLPSDLIGITFFRPDLQQFVSEKGPIFTNILIADEINRAPPKVQSALLEAMAERQVTLLKETLSLDKPFFVMATQNPIEQEGTYPLPEAQLDRFQFKLKVDFPKLDELMKIMDLTLSNEEVQLDSILSDNEILEMRKIISQLPMANPVKEYALKLILATHPEMEEGHALVKKYVEAGASPRAAQGLFSGAKVRAIMEGRFNVSFDDIKAIAYPVLRHRIILNFEGITEGITEEFVIDKILEDLKVV